MKQIEIDKLKQLDPSGDYGTIAMVLMDPKLDELNFVNVLYSLCKQIKEERDFYEKDNQKLTNVLKANNLYTSEILFGAV